MTINFGSTVTRYVRINVTANTGWQAAQLSELEIYGTSTSTGNLAQGKAMAESSHADVYGAGNANDGNQATYWESVNNAFPQWIQVDLAASLSINRVVAKLPTGWGARNQTFSVQGSTNGSTFTDIVASASYAFNPASANTVTVNFSATTTRWVRLRFTANTAWPAGQVSELEVYGPGTGDTTPPIGTGHTLVHPERHVHQPVLGSLHRHRRQRAGRIRRVSQRQPGDQRRSWHHDLDRHPTDYGHGVVLRPRPRRCRQPVGQQQHGDPYRDHCGHHASDHARNAVLHSQWDHDQPQLGRRPPTPAAAAWPAMRSTATAVSPATTNATTTTFADTQPVTATVSYYVRAKDGAEQLLGQQQHRDPHRQPAAGLHQRRPCQAGHRVRLDIHTFIAANANDGAVTTYWEGRWLTRQHTHRPPGREPRHHRGPGEAQPGPGLGHPYPEPPGPRAGAVSERLHECGPGGSNYTFTQGTNVVSIPVTATLADVQLRFNSNTGAPSGQVAEFEVCGTPAPNPDLTVSNVTWSPTSPVETSTVTLSATVANIGDQASPASSVNFYLGSTLKGSASVGALAAGGSTTVNLNAGTLTAASYVVSCQGGRGQRRDRAQRRQQQRHRLLVAGGGASAELGPRARALVHAEQPVGGQHGHVQRRHRATRAT